MSRAHIDEHAVAPEEEPTPLKSPLPPGARNHMTPEGASRQAAELSTLQTQRRPELVSKAAAEPGAGPARRDLAECDRRIAYLTRMQALLEVVDPRSQRTDRVRFGATVTVRMAAGEERRLRIVGVDETTPGGDEVSWISPVARALMGARVGDVVQVDLPAGRTDMVVLAVEYGRAGG